ncbi:MAG: hypothetical protein ABWY00_03670, partial [Dongiaceae bacterium]
MGIVFGSLRHILTGLAMTVVADGMSVGAVAAASGDCLGSLRPALVAGGFSGATDCGAADIDIQHIGNT